MKRSSPGMVPTPRWSQPTDAVAEPSIIERLNGERERLGANRPFLMNDPERVDYVESGHIDVFAVESRAGEVVGRRRFITRVPVGEMALGATPLPLPDAGGGMLCLLAVPSQDTVVVRGERAGLDGESFDLQATIWLDQWVARLSDFVASERSSPRHTHLLEADPDVPVPAGATLTAQHLDVIWVTSTAELRYLGRRDMGVKAPEPLLPMTERTWLEVDSDTKVTAVYTPTALLTGKLWPALDRFGMMVLRLAAIADADAAGTLSARRRAGDLARRESSATALLALREVLEPKGKGAVARTDREPLGEAARLVAESIGVALDAGARPHPSADPAKLLRMLAGRSRMHLRWVALESGWWKMAGPSMVGFAAGADGGQKPLALLSDDRGGYRVVDPASGDSRPVDAAAAAGIGRRGAVFYAPLPESARSIAKFAGFALHRRWPDFGAIILCAVLAGLTSLVAPILTGQFLTEVVPRGDTSAWLAVVGAMVAAALGTGAFQLVRGFAMLRIQSRLDERAANAVWGRLMSLPTRFFRDFSAGDLSLRANGTTGIRAAVATAGAAAVTGVAFTISSFGLLFYLHWPLALLVAALLVAQSTAVWLLTLGKLRHERRSQHLAGELNGFVYQILAGLAKLRVANAGSLALDRWLHQYGAWRRETLAGQYWAAATDAFLAMTQPLTLLAIFASVSVLLGAAGETFDLGMFLSFHAAFGQLSAGASSLTAAAVALTNIVPTVERLKPILDTAPEPREGVEFTEIKGDIEFDNVTFRYAPDERNAVEDISFQIRQGDYVAFVGPSGCGKSTIYRLLLGFERPDAGTVFLDGHSLAGLDMNAVRGRFGVVLQNGRVTAGSVYENIAGTNPLPLDEAWAAARAAALEKEIKAMPMGMHTRIPEGGAGLSVGQKQRLLIARSLALKPRVMLFDEATSALDNRSQEKVQDGLKDLGVTRLVIAHRLSSIRLVDRIYVLRDGRIVESGDYEELLRNDGVFAALANRQLVA